MTITVSAASIDQMAGIGDECPPTCSCSESPAVEPDCIASRAVACSDGSAASIAMGKTSDTSALASYRLTATDGTFCEFELFATWVGR